MVKLEILNGQHTPKKSFIVKFRLKNIPHQSDYFFELDKLNSTNALYNYKINVIFVKFCSINPSLVLNH